MQEQNGPSEREAWLMEQLGCTLEETREEIERQNAIFEEVDRNFHEEMDRIRQQHRGRRTLRSDDVIGVTA